jgi:ribosomal-protein-alanine N-acetyltransferase
MKSELTTHGGVVLKVRQMQAADLDQVIVIEEGSFSHPWSREQFQFELARAPISRCFVIEDLDSQDDCRVAAFLTSWLIADEMHITNVAVSPNQRGKGVARFLLTGVLDEIVSQGGKWCQLEVRESNDAAMGLYLKLGFQNLGTRRGYYSDGEDAVIMGREL